MRCLDDCHTYLLNDGPMSRGDMVCFYRLGMNGHEDAGTTNEELIKVLIHRLDFLNNKWMDGKFRCRENSIAITKLEEALMWLEKRTADRLKRGVEGTHSA